MFLFYIAANWCFQFTFLAQFVSVLTANDVTFEQQIKVKLLQLTINPQGNLLLSCRENCFPENFHTPSTNEKVFYFLL